MSRPPAPTPRPVRRVTPAAASAWPLHGTAASRRIEQQAQQALPAHTLMQRAGAAVAQLALALAPHARRIWVACGPGNNGGDGLEAAMHLRRAGRPVQVSLLGDPARLPADARASLQRAQEAGVPVGPDPLPPADARPGDLAIDALLGLGSSRAPEGVLAQAVAGLRQWPGTVLCVDLPTGLAADTGQLPGGTERAVHGHHTLSLLTLKPGLFTASGRDCAGQVWFDDLDVHDDAAPDAWLCAREDAPPARRHAQHKGSFGDVLVLGGATGMTGAALLAGRAAIAAGAGRVFVSPLGEAPLALDPQAPELMLRDADHAAALDWSTLTVTCGCGGGTAVRAVLPKVLGSAGRLVLDADALNAIAADPMLQSLLEARGRRGAPTVLTPHPLEAARLLALDGAQAVQRDRLGAARALSERYRCVVVLKGSGSVIAAAGEAPWINLSGNAALATAGTGDVLAGWLAGLWSQGLEALPAARLAVHTHGAAADAWVAAHARPGPLTASRLIGLLAGDAP